MIFTDMFYNIYYNLNGPPDCGLHWRQVNLRMRLLLASFNIILTFSFQGSTSKLLSRHFKAGPEKPISLIKCKSIVKCFSVNVTFGSPENKVLISGLHVVCDLKCKGCAHVVGWKYVLTFILNWDFGIRWKLEIQGRKKHHRKSLYEEGEMEWLINY